MHEIDEAIRRLEDPAQLDAVREQVPALIAKTLDQLGPSLGYWEKLHLYLAIDALIASRNQQRDSRSWLLLSLTSLPKALARARSVHRPAVDTTIAAMDFDRFKAVIAQL